MFFLVLIIPFVTNMSLAAQTYSNQSYSAPANPAQPTSANTGYVLVPESQLKDIYGPKEPPVNLKDLTATTLSAKTDALGARSDINTSLIAYKKSSSSLKEAEDLKKAAEKLISDRKKVHDEQAEKLKNSIKQAQNINQKAKDSIKKLRDGKKTAKKPSDASDAERVASITTDITSSLETTISQANAELTKGEK